MKNRYQIDDKTKIILFIVGLIILISTMIFVIYYQKQGENYNYIKQNKNKYLVYTKYEENKDDSYVIVPYLNIKGKNAKLINDNIDSYVSPLLENDDVIISYEYDINGIILSLVVKILDNNDDYALEPVFISYNFNLDTLEIISDDSLLDYFGIDQETAKNIIDDKLHEYYEKIIEEEYYSEEECDYSCFLEYRGISNILDSISYYVKDKKLYAYRPFIIHSIFGEENFFKLDDYDFLIATKESS